MRNHLSTSIVCLSLFVIRWFITIERPIEFKNIAITPTVVTTPTVIPLPKSATHFANCDVPCWINKRMPLVGTKTVYDEYGRSTKFIHTMEGPKHYPRIQQLRDGQHAFSTTDFNSEVPLPYFSWAEYSIQEPQVDFDTAIKGAVFIARNCGSLNKREGLVKKLRKYIRVDAISSCLNNAPWPEGIERRDKNGAMGKYLFYLSFENECSNDYITEKLWGSFSSGSLPIYYGAPNVDEHVPEDSIIQLSHDNVDDVGPMLAKLMNDKEGYDHYHRWRKMELPDWFVDKYDFTHIHGMCRSCRYNVYRHNKDRFGWDHANQNLIDLRNVL